MGYALLGLLLLCLLAVYAFMQRPEFGKRPGGKSLIRVRESRNYRGGQFRNLSRTPNLAKGANFFSVLYKFIFRKSERARPKGNIPFVKTDLMSLEAAEDAIVWFGHSSYFMQIGGKSILVDPVFSGSASPIAGTTESFAGSDAYGVGDLPQIDLLLLTHDHWDHLDYKTIIGLKPKVKNVLTGLGTGAHLRAWGYDANIIIEKDWYETANFGDLRFHVTPARHFSGRGLRRNGTLWVSFVLETRNRSIYIGGDSGFDAHFAEIGKRFGPFDLAILECGQYNHDWPYIHMLPEQIIPAAKALGAKAILPVHWGKFSLALHAWDEPVTKLTQYAAEARIPLWTPVIGEKINTDKPQEFSKWWETVD